MFASGLLSLSLETFCKKKKWFSIWRNLHLKHNQDALFLGGSSPFIVCVLVAQSFPSLCDLVDCSPPGSSVWRRIRSWLPFPSLGDLPDPGIESRSCIPDRGLMPEPSRKASSCVALYNLLCTFRENKFDIYIMLRDGAMYITSLLCL